MLDSMGRDIDYLRVSLTDRCNLRCVYCMPEEGIQKVTHNEILRYEEVLQIIRAFAELGGKKIRFTGGEPLILKDIEKLIAKTANIAGIEDISLTTNGILLLDKAEKLKEAGLKRINISLDTLDKAKYKEITRGGDLEKVLAGIEKCLELGITPIKINCVLIKGFNDDEIEILIKLTKDYPIEVRFIELMPLGEGQKYFSDGYISSSEVLAAYPQLKPLKQQKGSTSRMYKLTGAEGKVGLISPLSCKFCADCTKIRLTATGKVKPCLHSETEYDLKPYLQDDNMLINALREIILDKPAEHHLEQDKVSQSRRMMYQIGG